MIYTPVPGTVIPTAESANLICCAKFTFFQRRQRRQDERTIDNTRAAANAEVPPIWHAAVVFLVNLDLSRVYKPLSLVT